MELFSKYVNYKKIAFPTFLQYIEKISSTKEIEEPERERKFNKLSKYQINKRKKKTILSIAESFCNKQDFKQHLSIQLLNCFLK